MKIFLGIIIIAVWLYILSVFKRCRLSFWHFIWGSFGLFIFMMIYLRPVLTMPLAQVVAAVSGLFGSITGMFSSYFKYGIILIDTMNGSISLIIDFECSGILEIMAFLSLLVFFDVYRPMEKLAVGVAGTLYIILANALRIIVICTIIHFFGVSAYHVAHTFIGRIVFYVLSVLLYFFVFTKTQVIRQRLGGFNYGHSE